MHRPSTCSRAVWLLRGRALRIRRGVAVLFLLAAVLLFVLAPCPGPGLPLQGCRGRCRWPHRPAHPAVPRPASAQAAARARPVRAVPLPASWRASARAGPVRVPPQPASARACCAWAGPVQAVPRPASWRLFRLLACAGCCRRLRRRLCRRLSLPSVPRWCPCAASGSGMGSVPAASPSSPARFTFFTSLTSFTSLGLRVLLRVPPRPGRPSARRRRRWPGADRPSRAPRPSSPPGP